MDYLARREHGRVELATKLEKAGFEPDTSESAVSELAAEGLQSDTRFVESFVQSRISQGKGPARIRAELREKRIEDSLIEAGLADAGEDWSRLAATVRTRKFGHALPSDFKDKAKQMRFLQYRGFESEHIRSAVSAGDD